MTDRIDPAEVARLRAELAVLRNRHGLAVLAVRMDMHERLLDTADEVAALRAENERLRGLLERALPWVHGGCEYESTEREARELSDRIAKELGHHCPLAV